MTTMVQPICLRQPLLRPLCVRALVPTQIGYHVVPTYTSTRTPIKQLRRSCEMSASRR